MSSRLSMRSLRPRLLFLALAIAGFTTPAAAAGAASSEPAVKVIAPGLDSQAPRGEAAITPLDRLQVTVFREPDLSAADVQVDEGGRVLLPLVGALNAAGKSTEALAAEIGSKLRQYIKAPQVAVSVTKPAVRRVTVAGSVMQPGVYPLEGRTTLLQAVALAQGPSQVASLNQTLIFRTINGQRTAARFDLGKIANGKDPDPEVLPGDTVAIGSSKLKTAWRDVVMTMRSFNIFSLVP